MNRRRGAPLCVVSLGGNALLRRGESGTIEEQFEHARTCTAQISRMLRQGRRVVVTHGNGPIVGNIVIRNEAARNTVPPMPLYICDADSEGGIGFMIQQTLYNHLRRHERARPVVTLITQVVVDPDDPAFAAPTKPIGPWYTAGEAARLEAEKGWRVVRARPGGEGEEGRAYRRVVPSPRPLRIVEAAVIRRLAREGVVVIAAGGGGVPVAEGPEGELRGVEAVVDKDLATAVLARELGAEAVLILTDVDRVYLDFGQADQRGLGEVSVAELKEYRAQGHFPPGTMGPKVDAALEFLEAGGREVVITSPELAVEAMQGRAGTRIVP
ncbi:MAG: carbamate kinase [Thermodesulfobacteriota bacterium]